MTDKEKELEARVEKLEKFLQLIIDHPDTIIFNGSIRGLNQIYWCELADLCREALNNG